MICGFLTSMSLGAIHLAGWNFAFPTTADKWLWRASSIALIAPGFPVMLLFGSFTLFLVLQLASGRLGLKPAYPAVGFKLTFLVWSLALFIYGAARLILIVLTIRLLFYLPSGAFEANWAKNIPHMG